MEISSICCSNRYFNDKILYMPQKPEGVDKIVKEHLAPSVLLRMKLSVVITDTCS